MSFWYKDPVFCTTSKLVFQTNQVPVQVGVKLLWIYRSWFIWFINSLVFKVLGLFRKLHQNSWSILPSTSFYFHHLDKKYLNFMRVSYQSWSFSYESIIRIISFKTESNIQYSCSWKVVKKRFAKSCTPN